MQVLKDAVLCHPWLYTQACVYTGKANAASRGHILYSDSGQEPFIPEIYLFERFALALGRGIRLQFGLSIYPPAFHQSRALMNRGVLLTFGKSSCWQSVSVVSCKQPCGVKPHLPQELALLWEGDT